MQLLGTECGRQIIHPNIWVNATFADYKEKIKELSGYSTGIDGEFELSKYNNYPSWIITDVRFPNEAKAIKDKGGILIRCERTYYTEDKRYKIGFDPFEKEHPSETALDSYKDWDYVIKNDGSLEDLLTKVKDIVL